MGSVRSSGGGKLASRRRTIGTFGRSGSSASGKPRLNAAAQLRLRLALGALNGSSSHFARLFAQSGLVMVFMYLGPTIYLAVSCSPSVNVLTTITTIEYRCRCAAPDILGNAALWITSTHSAFYALALWWAWRARGCRFNLKEAVRWGICLVNAAVIIIIVNVLLSTPPSARVQYELITVLVAFAGAFSVASYTGPMLLAALNAAKVRRQLEQQRGTAGDGAGSLQIRGGFADADESDDLNLTLDSAVVAAKPSAVASSASDASPPLDLVDAATRSNDKALPAFTPPFAATVPLLQ
ncbi:hypothetical protein H9P43_007136 [Blastocladiella emersonii ATCC 22665]|nr:hypothetical protein H9P43_007136 [Blastocladiella emersonii ATCC 22665]